MTRVVRTFWLIFAGTVMACGAAPARYAGWEPMPVGVPAVAQRERAWQRLAQSRSLWQEWRASSGLDYRMFGVPRGYKGRDYSYVRARQSGDRRVEFTLFVVGSRREAEPERVLLRALVSGDPEHLDSYRQRAPAPPLRSEWLERGGAVGSHREGAAPRTVDELYDDCARLLRAHPELSPHLYFHPNGVLMHCGFAARECGNCPEISIESFSHYSFDWEWPHDDPAKWVCGASWGVFAPDTELPELSSADQCAPSYLPPPPRPPAPTPIVNEGEVEGTGAGLQDICEIDPKACPAQLEHTDGRAFWGMLLVPCAAYPARPPSALEIGKALPLATWSFPFSLPGDGIECGDSIGTVQRRYTPVLRNSARPEPEN